MITDEMKDLAERILKKIDFLNENAHAQSAAQHEGNKELIKQLEHQELTFYIQASSLAFRLAAQIVIAHERQPRP